MAKAKPVVVDLPERLTIAAAEALHELLEPVVTSTKDVVLNAADVAAADTAGLQLLCSFVDELKKHSISFSWKSPSSVLSDAADQLGVGALLSLS